MADCFELLTCAGIEANHHQMKCCSLFCFVFSSLDSFLRYLFCVQMYRTFSCIRGQGLWLRLSMFTTKLQSIQKCYGSNKAILKMLLSKQFRYLQGVRGSWVNFNQNRFSICWKKITLMAIRLFDCNQIAIGISQNKHHVERECGWKWTSFTW